MPIFDIMSNIFFLHILSDAAFESMIVLLCQEVLGIGTITFSTGKDGGRDGKFQGTANSFPSNKEPASGKFIVQAKHSSNPVASCSDREFDKLVLGKELPRIRRLVESGQCDNYLLFTNRKLSGVAEPKLGGRIEKETGVKNSWLIGLETIEIYLKANPKVQKAMGLDNVRLPFQIEPDQMAAVIQAFYEQRDDIETAFDSAHALKYTDLMEKNQINGLSGVYYNYIRESSEPYFEDIREFLNNPKNQRLEEYYHNTADELKQKLIAFRGRFESFDEALTAIYDLFTDSNSTIREHRRLATVFLHYMYCNCDIGENYAPTS